MKKIEAIIRSFKLDDVKESLNEIGVLGLTVTEVKGFGRQKGKREFYRAAEYIQECWPKIKLEIIIPDDLVIITINTIKDSAKSGKIGDGKIFIFPVEEVIRIRTGERGEDVL